jgi:hypothetical protein
MSLTYVVYVLVLFFLVLFVVFDGGGAGYNADDGND